MSLVADISKKRLEHEQPKRCKLGGLLDVLNKEDKEAMDYAIAMVVVDQQKAQYLRHFTVSWLTDVLNRNSRPIGKTVISDHLAGRCACEQAGE